MHITRNVILDLLPLYLANELSDDSRALVEEFLATDPQLASLAEQASQTMTLEPITIPLTKDDEMKSFQRTKQLMNQQSLLMAVAFFLTLLPLSIRGGSEGIRWAWAEQPIVAGVSLVAAAILWIVYISLSRQLSRLD